MSVLLFRINQSDIFYQKDQIINTEVDIVLLDNSVFHGIIKKINQENVIIINMIRNKYTFSINDISEIVYSK